VLSSCDVSLADGASVGRNCGVTLSMQQHGTDENKFTCEEVNILSAMFGDISAIFCDNMQLSEIYATLVSELL
jgi:hypothetical protein